jgi:thioredoxin-dependent peroxiredoxin
MAKDPHPGEVAPDFELTGTHGPFRLSEHRGERVVLLFYPGDNHVVCTRQFCSYRDRVDHFSKLGVRAVGISPQDIASHRDFIAKHGLTLPLLADSHRDVSKLYDVHSSVIGTRRATIVIDEMGVVRYRHDNLLSLSYDSVNDLSAALARLN